MFTHILTPELFVFLLCYPVLLFYSFFSKKLCSVLHPQNDLRPRFVVPYLRGLPIGRGFRKVHSVGVTNFGRRLEPDQLFLYFELGIQNASISTLW